MSNLILENDMQALQELVVRGVAVVRQNFIQSVSALHERNDALALKVQEADSKIDDMEMAIDQAVLSVLYRQRPVAQDLRRAFTAAKIATDLERIGDSAVSLSRASIKLSQLPETNLKTDTRRMAQIGLGMLDGVAQGLLKPDPALLQEIIAQDKELDRLHHALIEEATKMAVADGSLAPQAVQWVIVARSLERVGDHVKNIAEELIFLVRAVDVRHSHTPV